MSDIALNFVPIKEQDRSVTIYRKLVDDSSLPKADDDFRVNLPEKDGDDEWQLFDVSTSEKENYKSYSYNFFENSVLTVHLIYSDLLEFMSVAKAKIEYYIPIKAITLKEVRFVTKKFDDGATEIVVKPYYLKSNKQYGFLLEHKYSLNEGEPFNRQTQIHSLSLDKSGKPNIYFYSWHVEVDLRQLKTTLGMEALKCKTAEMCEKELWVYFLAYNLIRLLMAEAALRTDAVPRQLSFKHTLQIWVAWSGGRCFSSGEENVEILFALIAQKRVGQRPGRIEPRAVKRRPKPFVRLTVPRQVAREQIAKRGHGKKLGLNCHPSVRSYDIAFNALAWRETRSPANAPASGPDSPA